MVAGNPTSSNRKRLPIVNHQHQVLMATSYHRMLIANRMFPRWLFISLTENIAEVLSVCVSRIRYPSIEHEEAYMMFHIKESPVDLTSNNINTSHL